MPEIYETAIVEKRNMLNELRTTLHSTQELRLFSIYLSKINPYDTNTRVVRFPLSDFQRIMNFGKLNIAQLKASANSVLKAQVFLPKDNGGFKGVNLFETFEVDQDSSGKWYIEINATNAALPLMFDFKDRYFKYELWNALRLKAPSQIRMYEILKQYEYIGTREIEVKELQELLGVNYSRWDRFKAKVLDSCQQALKETTDICFSYERGKTGKGGKWLTIVFYIRKNKDYVDQLTLDEFIAQQPEPVPITIGAIDDNTESDESAMLFNDDEECTSAEIDYGSSFGNLIGEALGYEFTPEQVRVLQDLVIKFIPGGDALKRCNYLVEQVHKMNTHNPINRYKYLCRMIENDIADREGID
jgi:plasmid replication initiation protein